MNGYINWHCRCDACSLANNIGHHEYMQRHPEQYEKSGQRNRRNRGSDPKGYISREERIARNHGTILGVRRHDKLGEMLCAKCERFENTRQTDIRVAREKKLLPHGTWGAYQRHRRDGEEPCSECREFVRLYYNKGIYNVKKKGA